MSNFSTKIKAELDTSDIEKQIKNISKQFVIEIRTGKFDTSKITVQMKNAGNSAGKAFAKGFKNNISSINAMTQEAANKRIALNKASKLSEDITAWMKQNPKAASKYGDVLNILKEQLKGVNGTSQEVSKTTQELSSNFEKIKSTAKEAGLTAKSFFASFKDVGLQLLGLTSTVAIIQKGIKIAKEMYQNVYEIDTAMSDLKKVTNETDAAYSSFLSGSADSAKKLGRTVSDLISQTTEWSKLGYSLNEAEKLSKVSSIYANVNGVDDKTAVSNIDTAMKAFEIDGQNAMRIADVYTELGNKFAVSAANLGDGVSKSAASMHSAGADLEQTSAMLTGISKITQNAPEAGDSLNIFSLRIRGLKDELEKLGEDVDPAVDSISKVQSRILDLTNGEVNIFDSTGNFRNYYEIMKDIAAVYDSLNSTDKSSLSEILFGKQRGNDGEALIQAFQSGQIQNAYQTALGSDGAAMAEQAEWLETLEAKTNQFKAAYDELSQTVLDSDFLKVLIDLGATALSVLSKIIDNIGILNTLFISLAAAKGIKSIS